MVLRVAKAFSCFLPTPTPRSPRPRIADVSHPRHISCEGSSFPARGQRSASGRRQWQCPSLSRADIVGSFRCRCGVSSPPPAALSLRCTSWTRLHISLVLSLPSHSPVSVEKSFFRLSPLFFSWDTESVFDKWEKGAFNEDRVTLFLGAFTQAVLVKLYCYPFNERR